MKYKPECCIIFQIKSMCLRIIFFSTTSLFLVVVFLLSLKLVLSLIIQVLQLSFLMAGTSKKAAKIKSLILTKGKIPVRNAILCTHIQRHMHTLHYANQHFILIFIFIF